MQPHFTSVCSVSARDLRISSARELLNMRFRDGFQRVCEPLKIGHELCVCAFLPGDRVIGFHRISKGPMTPESLRTRLRFSST